MRSVFRISTALCAMLAAFAAPASSHAAEKKKSAPAGIAYLRVWTGYLSEKRTLRVTLRISGRKGSPMELAAQAGQYVFGEYVEVPSGGGTFEVSKLEEPKQSALTILTQFNPNSFTTLLVTELRDEVKATVIDDTPAETETAELTIRNLVPELSQVLIEAGPDLHARLASSSSFLHVRGLARQWLQVETTGASKPEEKFQWSNDIDFTKLRRATIVICPDPYGRLRPRVMVDGQNATTPPAGEGVTKPAL